MYLLQHLQTIPHPRLTAAAVLVLPVAAILFWLLGSFSSSSTPLVDSIAKKSGTNSSTSSNSFSLANAGSGAVDDTNFTNIVGTSDSNREYAKIVSHSNSDFVPTSNVSTTGIEAKEEARQLKKQLEDLRGQFNDYKHQYKLRPASSSGVADTFANMESEQLKRLDNLLQIEKKRSREFATQLTSEKNRADALAADLKTQTALLNQLKSETAENDIADNGSENSSSLPTPKFRQWMGKTGREIEMAFIHRDADGKLIFIDRKNQLFSVSPSHLLANDLKLIESTYR